jgi:trigger factor
MEAPQQGTHTLNIHTELLEKQIARLTVSLDSDQVEKARNTAARKISNQVRIPGFRKGKIPYRVLVNFVGEAAIAEEMAEILANDVYPKALDQAELAPYGPGSLIDFKLEPEAVFVFTLPLQPTATLNDYRSVRVDFSQPEVTDEMVNRSMRLMREQQAVIEPSSRPVEAGNRVTVDLYAKLLGVEGEAAMESAHDHDHGDEDEHAHHGLGDGEFLHKHDTVLILGEENEEPAPGFKQALIGINVDETREFELTYPDDKDEYGDEFAGKTARFKVTVKKIETMILPELTDDFAARVTEKEEKPLTLLELRVRMRENITRNLEESYLSDYADDALDKMVEGATVLFPDAMLKDQTEMFMRAFDQDLRRQGLTLDDYASISNKTRDELAEEYREAGSMTIRRALVLQELRETERIEATDEQVDAEVQRMLAQFGDQAEKLRGAIDTPAMRDNLRNNLTEKATKDRIVAIARGEAPELPAVEAATPEPAPVTEASE